MKRRRFPFSWLPASWGLSGRTRQIAEAEYYFEGEELAHMLIDIEQPQESNERRARHLDVDLKYGRIAKYDHEVAICKLSHESGPDLERKLLRIDHAHKRISDYDFDIKMIEADDPNELKLAELAVDLKHGKISRQQHDRQAADIKQEPYISILRSEYNPQLGLNGMYFEFEWNDLWIEYLRLNGYYGMTEEQVVEQWFADICRSVAGEIPPPERDEVVPFNSGRVINRVRRDDGSEEYS